MFQTNLDSIYKAKLYWKYSMYNENLRRNLSMLTYIIQMLVNQVQPPLELFNFQVQRKVISFVSTKKQINLFNFGKKQTYNINSVK